MRSCRARTCAEIAALGAAALAAACAAGAPDLPFDARPAMGAVRADAEALAGDLAAGDLAAALAPARRLAALSLAERRAGVDPAFRELEERFRTAAAAVRDSLQADDAAAARAGYTGLRFACDDCHRRFRPGGTRGR